jgi:hypothetical protein
MEDRTMGKRPDERGGDLPKAAHGLCQTRDWLIALLLWLAYFGAATGLLGRGILPGVIHGLDLCYIPAVPATLWLIVCALNRWTSASSDAILLVMVYTACALFAVPLVVGTELTVRTAEAWVVLVLLYVIGLVLGGWCNVRPWAGGVASAAVCARVILFMAERSGA